MLRFRNEGFPKSVFSGFALEIIQDECPKKYSPGTTYDFNSDRTNDSKSFKFYNDQINRVAWPNLPHDDKIEKAVLLNRNTEILSDSDIKERIGSVTERSTSEHQENTNLNNTTYNIDVKNLNSRSKRFFQGDAIKSLYFYTAPDNIWNEVENQYDSRPRETEETTYVDTSNIKVFLANGVDDFRCRTWGVLQWTLLTQEPLWKQMAKCEGEISNPVLRKCYDLNYLRGYFNSPGYPYYYPSNLDICYR